jgi:uncharacterized protein YciI
VKQYVYVLKLVERLWVVDAWTKQDNAIVDQHFTYLKALLANRQLILAGKTGGNDEATFGLVIFEALDDEEAQRIMENDPSVKQGIMRATLSSYHVALARNL